MKRREFITLLGGAAATWPLTARAQQSGMPVIGLLNPTSPDIFADRLRGFRQGLNENGYIEGDNVTIVYRWAENQMERLTMVAAEFISRPLAVIATTGSLAAAFGAKAATVTIPILITVPEGPVK